MDNLVKIALGLLCIGFACSFDEKQKRNAEAGNDEFSKLIWSADQVMNTAVGTGLLVNAVANTIINKK